MARAFDAGQRFTAVEDILKCFAKVSLVRVASCLAALIVALVAPLEAFAQAAKPVRHLVYAFTWGTTTDLQMQNSGMTESGGTAGAGMSDFGGGNAEKGTIAVDVIREQPDRGLVISVSEQAQAQRSSPPATCVVFGNTNVICDPNAKINPEEVELVRLLGPGFIDPTQIDPKNHWQVRQANPDYDTVSDFTIASNVNGIVKVEESRTVTGTTARPYTRSVTETIGYDINRTLPTSVTEDTTERSEGTNQYQTIKSQTTLQLASDSLAAKP